MALMEELVMLVVFALAAALCLQAFVKSDQMSRRSEARDQAVALCQSAAEAVRASEGDFRRAAELLGAEQQEDSLRMFYGEDWQPAQPTSPGAYPFGYTLGAAREESGVPGLGKARVWVVDDHDEAGEVLFSLDVTWQEEVSAHG